MSNTPDTCPVCGADVPTGARACPDCGSDEKTGWSQKARYDELGIPDDSFNYEDFVEREFHPKVPKRKFGWLWLIAAILLLIAFALPFLRR